MRKTWIAFWFVFAMFVLGLWSSAAKAMPAIVSDTPTFTASDSMSLGFTRLSYNMTQYSDRAQLSVWGNTPLSITNVFGGVWQETGPASDPRLDSKGFSFEFSFDVQDGMMPSGQWRFSQNKGMPISPDDYASANTTAYTWLSQNWRWDQASQTSIRLADSWMSTYNGNLYIPGVIDSANMGSYDWGVGSGKSNDEVLVRNHHTFYVSGSGHFFANAETAVVPEPASLGLVGAAMLGLMIRNRRAK